MQNNLSIYKCWWKYLKDGLQAAKEHFFLLRFLFPHAVLSTKSPPPHRAAFHDGFLPGLILPVFPSRLLL